MKRLGKYIELREIGRGASATVYRGKHRELGALRALKVFGPGSWHSKNRLDEAVCQSRVEHESIIRVMDLEHDRDAGVSYMVMEYAPLGTLRARLEQEALDPASACALAAQMARALFAAHEKGICHLDLKPENVLFFTPDTAKISDFGLARGDDEHQQDDPVVGTPGYMAPEQLEGRAGPGCDLWALGAVLHEMLAGRPAFEGHDVAAISAAMENGPAPLPPAVDPDLRRLVLDLLAYSAADRPSSAGEVADELQRLAARLVARPRVTRPTVQAANRCESCNAAIPLGLTQCPDCRPRQETPAALQFPPGPLLRPKPARLRSRLIGLALGLAVAGAAAWSVVWALSPGGSPTVATETAQVHREAPAPPPPAVAALPVVIPETPKAKPSPPPKARTVKRAASPAPKARAAAAKKAAAGARRAPAVRPKAKRAAGVADPLGPALKSGSPQRALDALHRHLAAHPEHLGARRNLALLYLQMGNHKAAVVQLNSILRLKPDDVEAAGTLDLIRAMRARKTAQSN